ncbi:alpha/beta-hydrolase [Trametopsis cervina]|nr:alpha/beta-hydrolase [Trametopsis cervina]
MSFANLRKIPVHYDEAAVQNMISMLKAAPFPAEAPVEASTPWSLGIDYDYLKSLKHEFETTWSWTELEQEINKFDNFLVDVTTVDNDKFELHFVHKKSERRDAVPLLLLHGWPSSFLDFLGMIEPLTNPPRADLPAFHVVIPSLPGFFKSTRPRRDGFNLADIGRVFNGLMVDLLGYTKYGATHGDWGAMTARIMTNKYPENLVAALFTFILANAPPGVDDSTFSDVEKQIMRQNEQFTKSENAYFRLNATKPLTIGFAIGSSPLAVLSYIGEKLYAWADPTRVKKKHILDTVALYFLSGSFASSTAIYNQAYKGRNDDGSTWEDNFTLPIRSKAFGISAFPYESGGAPRAFIEPLGNLSYYKEHAFGGHFPALEAPDEYVEDVREFFAVNF